MGLIPMVSFTDGCLAVFRAGSAVIIYYLFKTDSSVAMSPEKATAPAAPTWQSESQ